MKIDIHAHFCPQEYLEEISRIGAESTDPFARGWYGQMAGKDSGNPKMWAVEERLEEMDGAGVDLQVLTTPTPYLAPDHRDTSIRLTRTVNDSLAGLCLFTSMTQNANSVPEFLESVVGWDYDLDRLLEIGDRIATMRTAFNAREGHNVSQWNLPRRVLVGPNQGPSAGIEVENETQVREYLGLMGWDPVTGKPTPEALQHAGLADVAADLWP